ncbi:MAG: hypothetical protein ABI988_08920, partial [Nitrospirota bacterium]
MLRADPSELVARLVGENGGQDFSTLVSSVSEATLAHAIRDLGGHDLSLLLDTYDTVEEERPTIIFAYT